MSDKCYCVAKLICRCIATEEILCEYCGRMYLDVVMHFICTCEQTVDLREALWIAITNDFDISIGVAIYNLDDLSFTNILLGAELLVPLNQSTELNLRKNFMSFVYNVFHCVLHIV